MNLLKNNPFTNIYSSTHQGNVTHNNRPVNVFIDSMMVDFIHDNIYVGHIDCKNIVGTISQNDYIHSIHSYKAIDTITKNRVIEHIFIPDGKVSFIEKNEEIYSILADGYIYSISDNRHIKKIRVKGHIGTISNKYIGEIKNYGEIDTICVGSSDHLEVFENRGHVKELRIIEGGLLETLSTDEGSCIDNLIVDGKISAWAGDTFDYTTVKIGENSDIPQDLKDYLNVQDASD